MIPLLIALALLSALKLAVWRRNTKRQPCWDHRSRGYDRFTQNGRGSF